MKKRVLLVLASITLMGCDANALRFAAETRRLLEEYQKKIAAEITDARGFYQRNSALLASAAWRRLNDGLAAGRIERSTALSADYMDGRKSSSLMRSEIRDYVLTEVEERRRSLSADVDSCLPYMERLNALEADQEKVAALSRMIEMLAKPRSMVDETRELGQFVDDAKTGYNKLVCDDLSAKQKAAAAAIAANTNAARKDQLQSAKESIDKLIQDKKCGG
jgi:hypothetical protein